MVDPRATSRISNQDLLDTSFKKDPKLLQDQAATSNRNISPDLKLEIEP